MLLKTKIKTIQKIYIQQAFWLILVVCLSWALMAVRSAEPGNINSPLNGSGLKASDNVPVQRSSSATGEQDNNNSNKAGSSSSHTKENSVNLPVRSTLQKQENLISKSGKTYPIRVYKPMALPNDTFANQWWVEPTGMEDAWEIPAGDSDVTIAVIDTGFGLAHQEFSGRWATSSGETGAAAAEAASKLNCSDRDLPLNRSCNNIDDNFDGIIDNESGPTTVENPSWLNCTDQSIALDKSCNRIDDDGNGLIDDWRGWDFSNYDHSPQAGETNPDGEGTTHGTMTAGTLAANGNNSVGIAGVNWHAKILPIQALDDDEYGDSLTVGESVYYAVEQDVDIISISLGTSADDPYLREAILYAMENNIIVVAAAGNDGCNCMVYPARYPEVVAAGALSPDGVRSSFSSWGNNLDILAPGEDMTTPVWSKNNQVSAYATEIAGTSFATPFVAGVLGLMRSYQPEASWDEIIGAMMENSDRKSLTAANPHSAYIGFGHIDVISTLNRASQAFSPFTSYRFDGKILGSERIKKCDPSVTPGTFLYELSKSGRINYTINQYEKRQKVASGWSSKRLFGVCVGLPTDTPDFIRLLNLTAEIHNKILKQ